MKKMTLVLALLLCLVMSVLPLSGCKGSTAPGGENVVIDTSKTQLYVRYYAGGLGTDWLEEICSRFEEDFANVSFEEGKTGVQIVRKFEKTQVAADQIRDNNSDVFFMEHMSYSDAVNKGFLLNISDVVKDYAVTGYDGTGAFDVSKLIRESGNTIERKISSQHRAYYQVDGEYYGTPFYTGVHQIIYNKELFDTNNLYFNAASDQSLSMFDEMIASDAAALAGQDKWFVSSATDEKSKGPDGKAKTYADGMPATYGQLWVLMERMVRFGITPFILQEGAADHYYCAWDKDIWADAEGAEQMELNLSWSGTANTLLDGAQEKYTEEIMPKNAYLLQSQEGRLKALEFVEMILSDPKYVYSKSFDGSFTHLNAQQFFVKAGQEGNYISMKYGMLVDGSWWNVEAKEQFSNNTFLTREFGVMPLPKTDSSKVGSVNADGTHITKVDCYDANIFIKSNIAKERETVAKLFVSYASNDQSLNIFSKYTQAFRSMTYTLSKDTLANMTYYGKSAYEVYKDSHVISWLPTTEVTQNNLSNIAYRVYAVTNGRSDGISPMAALHNKRFNSASEYFEATKNYYVNNWTKLINLK